MKYGHHGIYSVLKYKENCLIRIQLQSYIHVCIVYSINILNYTDDTTVTYELSVGRVSNNLSDIFDRLFDA